MIVAKHSGGEGTQLKGYDGRQREISSKSGGTVTAAQLKRPGRHVPTEKMSQETPADYFQPVKEYDRPSKHPSR
jgi:hypothetical protein